MTNILVVDDDFREGDFFRKAFGDAVTVYRSAAALAEAVEGGQRWDLAFIDFDLQDAAQTGLTAWIDLRPVTPACVSYTRAAEAGRVLYNLATRHWFQSDAVLDKSLAEPETLRRYASELASGVDPTPTNVKRYLQHAQLVGEILPDAMSVLLWRKWNELGGNEPAIQRQLGLKPNVTRRFKERVSAPVATLLAEVFQRNVLNHGGTNAKFAGPLSNFAGENRKFFNAADLDRALSKSRYQAAE